jgi:hypothetical protein
LRIVRSLTFSSSASNYWLTGAYDPVLARACARNRAKARRDAASPRFAAGRMFIAGLAGISFLLVREATGAARGTGLAGSRGAVAVSVIGSPTSGEDHTSV